MAKNTLSYKQKRSIKRKKNYLIVSHITKSAKKAQQARDWGIDTIEKHYSIDAEKVYRLAIRAQRERARRARLRDMGLPPEIADRMRGWSDKNIDKALKEGILPKADDPAVRQRRKQWGAWSRNHMRNKKNKTKLPVIPDFLKDYAESLNKEADRHKEDRYGYGLVWYWFTFGGKVEDWKKQVKPDSNLKDEYIAPFLINYISKKG